MISFLFYIVLEFIFLVILSIRRLSIPIVICWVLFVPAYRLMKGRWPGIIHIRYGLVISAGVFLAGILFFCLWIHIPYYEVSRFSSPNESLVLVVERRDDFPLTSFIDPAVEVRVKLIEQKKGKVISEKHTFLVESSDADYPKVIWSNGSAEVTFNRGIVVSTAQL